MEHSIDYSAIKGIIFDYGGTIDTGGDHWSYIIYDGWKKAGVAAENGIFRQAYVYAERELARVRHILPEHNFYDLLLIKMRIELQWLAEHGYFAPALIDEKARLAADYCYDVARSHVESAKPVLDILSKHFPLVLVSNFYGNIESVLRDFGLDSYFKKIIESAVVGIRKPDPAIFALGVKALGMKADEVLVVGDSLRKDILPAESLGCKTAWIKGRGWTAEEDAQTHPSQIASLASLPGLLGVQ